jgi:hypothetical protein
MAEKKTEQEIREMLEWEEVYEECNGSGRWNKRMFTVVKDPETGALWGIPWGKGLTENQEHLFEDQPYLVEAYEETIPATTVTKYRPKT